MDGCFRYPVNTGKGMSTMTEPLWVTSTGYPIVPPKGDYVRIRGIDYKVDDVMWDFDIQFVTVYLK